CTFSSFLSLPVHVSPHYLLLWIRWSSGNVHSTVYKNLVLSLLLTSLAFLVGIDRTNSPVWCSVFAVFLDFLFVSALFWLLVVGVVTARLLLHPPPKSASCLATACLVAGLWTVPALMCVIPVGVVAMASSSFHQDFGYPHFCLVAPDMVLVLLTPIAILLLLVVVSMVVVVVLMKTQKSKRTPGSDSYNTTPGKIAASQNRTRRHLGIITVSLSLYLVTLGSGLLAIYGHAFPGPTSAILEIVFAISFTSLSGFMFVVLGLNKKVRSAILAKLEPKYQNSSLRAMADSNSFLTRLRVGGGGGEGRGGGGAGSLPRAPPTGRERGGHYQRQQRLLNEARMAARLSHEQGPTTSIDLFSMEAHPRTPHTSEPLYSRIAGDRPRGPTSTRTPPTSTPGPLPGTHRSSAHRTSGPRQPRPVLRPPRVAPPSSDADIETDSEVVVGRGRRAWYHVSASEFHEHEVVRPASVEISCTAHEGTPDTDDLSRMDPSGVSTIGQSDAEDGGRTRSREVEQGQR
ncbi:Adhesion G protein-coupled receptor L3, partial [Geodia barretti]